MTNMPGGFTDPMDATEEIQKICDQVKGEVQKNTKKVYEEFRAVKYTSQVVNGTNYLIKVHVGGHIYLHLKVYQSRPYDGGEVVLTSVHDDKDDTIVHL
ncbi:cystatin-A1-like [Seriola lalandi dorsalis]|uniref:cystatin-A1-like n=1 Tax=Seriola lalandi dorsalis TaxID=1841481 RepID=UPI000C6FB8D2|nr:cystatin-A1-like [Seriola lalandi dorsalis]XP_023272612.1 cystatin-A1-like [Seriola lalandi dorsalis]XP_056220964.1 cystatin-A1-like [Seriola aureovittata]